jgi:hypothetical protein
LFYEDIPYTIKKELRDLGIEEFLRHKVEIVLVWQIQSLNSSIPELLIQQHWGQDLSIFKTPTGFLLSIRAGIHYFTTL